MTNHTDLIARLRKGYEYGDSGVVLEAVDALEAAQAEIANLHTVMMVAAVEISEHWDAHCDAEGYGPVNLLRHLKNNYPERYGYDSHTVVRMEKERDAAKAEIAAVRKANIDCVNHFDALRIDYDQALARLAEIERQEPVQPIQGLQSVADALTIEQLNDKVGRLMAVQPSQAQAALDAILWYYENCTGSEPSISAFQQMVDRVVKMKPNFCESCAMDIATCDCVTPRPATVTVQPSQADAQDAARYRWLREYLPSDDLQYDDNLVLAKTGEDIDAAIDAAINAKEKL